MFNKSSHLKDIKESNPKNSRNNHIFHNNSALSNDVQSLIPLPKKGKNETNNSGNVKMQV